MVGIWQYSPQSAGQGAIQERWRGIARTLHLRLSVPSCVQHYLPVCGLTHPPARPPTCAVVEVGRVIEGIEGGEIHVGAVAHMVGHDIQNVVHPCGTAASAVNAGQGRPEGKAREGASTNAQMPATGRFTPGSNGGCSGGSAGSSSAPGSFPRCCSPPARPPAHPPRCASCSKTLCRSSAVPKEGLTAYRLMGQ